MWGDKAHQLEPLPRLHDWPCLAHCAAANESEPAQNQDKEKERTEHEHFFPASLLLDQNTIFKSRAQAGHHEGRGTTVALRK